MARKNTIHILCCLMTRAPLLVVQRRYSFLIVKAVASEIAARCDVQPMSGRRNTNLYGNRIVTVAGVPVPDRHPVMLTVALLGFSPARPSAFRMVAKTESRSEEHT